MFIKMKSKTLRIDPLWKIESNLTPSWQQVPIKLKPESNHALRKPSKGVLYACFLDLYGTI